VGVITLINPSPFGVGDIYYAESPGPLAPLSEVQNMNDWQEFLSKHYEMAITGGTHDFRCASGYIEPTPNSYKVTICSDCAGPSKFSF